MVQWKKKVLEEIKPSEDEESRVDELQSRLVDIASKYAEKENAKYVITVGSLAKDTWLSGTHDIDIFVSFSSRLEKKKLEKKGLEIGKAVFEEMGGDWQIEYAEHPYVRGKVNGFEADIVPCYDVPSEKIKSAVDRTPHHTKYVNSNLRSKQRDEVRLLKAFCHAHNIYSAKLSVQGFSGYLCELLIMKFGTFRKLMSEASSWIPGLKLKLDSKSGYKSPDKKKVPLVFVDPVDPKRNVAAALNLENMIKFISAAQEFDKNPSDKHFRPKRIGPITKSDIKKKIKNRETKPIVIEFKTPDVIDDILYPQMRKFRDRINDILREYDFIPLRSDFLVTKDKTYLFIELEVWKLPSIVKKVGPTVYSKKHTKEFFSKYDNPLARYIEDDKWVVEVERKWKLAGNKLKDSLNSKEGALKEKGIPSYMAVEISDEFKILGGNDITSLLKDKEFAIFLNEYYNKSL